METNTLNDVVAAIAAADDFNRAFAGVLCALIGVALAWLVSPRLF